MVASLPAILLFRTLWSGSNSSADRYQKERFPKGFKSRHQHVSNDFQFFQISTGNHPNPSLFFFSWRLLWLCFCLSSCEGWRSLGWRSLQVQGLVRLITLPGLTTSDEQTYKNLRGPSCAALFNVSLCHGDEMKLVNLVTTTFVRLLKQKCLHELPKPPIMLKIP